MKSFLKSSLYYITHFFILTSICCIFYHGYQAYLDYLLLPKEYFEHFGMYGIYVFLAIFTFSVDTEGLSITD